LHITPCTVAAAQLSDDYKLCAESTSISIENQSFSPLIQTYSWQLIDRQGNTVATATSLRFNYQFSDTGLYRIRLFTNIGLLCPDSTSAPIMVYPGTKSNFTFNGLCFGNPTRFMDASTTVYGSIIGRYWDLGEPSNPQNYSQGIAPVINYQSMGNKVAYLRVVNANGCENSLSQVLSITSEPPLQLSWRDTLICPPDTLQVLATGDGSFAWNAAPGLISGANSPTPSFAPLVTTTYRVTQTMGNCISRDSVRIGVINFVTLIAMSDTTICLGDSLQLRSTGNALEYQWTPAADLRTPLSANSVAQPSQSTTYHVKGFIGKCMAEDEVVVSAVPYPQVNAGPDQAICYGHSVQLSSQS
ncbi:MAG TPA: hypothetical protein VEC93_19620, partial [Anaerolineae bacterium]|nr:hypothetical protein [Anaerolineae bacterium]